MSTAKWQNIAGFKKFFMPNILEGSVSTVLLVSLWILQSISTLTQGDIMILKNNFDQFLTLTKCPCPLKTPYIYKSK